MNTLRLLNRRIAGGLSNQCQKLLSTEGPVSSERPRVEKSLNRVTLLGRVGKEGELRGTTDHPCLIFPLATSFSFKKASTGEYMTKTDWHRICVFQAGLRNIASTINKGDRILVEGSLSHQRFMDDNNKFVNITSIIADEIIFVGRRKIRDDEMEEYDL